MRLDAVQVPAALVALLVAALAVSLVACKGGQDANPTGSGMSATSEGVAAAQATPASDASGIILQTGQTGRSDVGGACKADEDCMEPLRCLRDGLCVVPPGVDGDVADTTPRVLLDVERDRPVRVFLEIADSFYERKRGLMWRTRMASDWGMLFVFDDEAARSFWMSNTYLPLDMIFIDTTGRIVSISENARPLNTGPRYASTGPARYVLEVNAGFAREHKLEAGQRVRLVDVDGAHEPAILQ